MSSAAVTISFAIAVSTSPTNDLLDRFATNLSNFFSNTFVYLLNYSVYAPSIVFESLPFKSFKRVIDGGPWDLVQWPRALHFEHRIKNGASIATRGINLDIWSVNTMCHSHTSSVIQWRFMTLLLFNCETNISFLSLDSRPLKFIYITPLCSTQCVLHYLCSSKTPSYEPCGPYKLQL